MKKGRRYIEPQLGKGDEKGKNIKPKKTKTSGFAFDGVSRPSTDEYRDNWKVIFGKQNDDE
tara:strand:- start:88 stop:270 length:183 start_codon:yes stop_codon:yes gene_type:complete